MNSPREVLAKRSSPVMDSACHWGGFVESVHALVASLTPLTTSAWGLAPGTISSPSLTPCCEGLAPFRENAGHPASRKGQGTRSAAGVDLFTRPAPSSYPLNSG